MIDTVTQAEAAEEAAFRAMIAAAKDPDVSYAEYMKFIERWHMAMREIAGAERV